MDTSLDFLATLVAMPAFHVTCLAIILAGCIWAVLSHAFDDTFTQRAAFMVTALGAVLQLSLVLETGYTSPGYGLMLAGCALYVTSTTVKYCRRWRASGRPSHPLRRSTDRMDLDSHFATTVPMPNAGRRHTDTMAHQHEVQP